MQIKTMNLTHTYDMKTPLRFTALDNISIELPTQGITAFIGHTGSGKTSMIKHFNGLLLPTAGEVNVNDLKITNSKKRKRQLNRIIGEQRKSIGMVFQFPEEQIFEDTVEAEIAFGIKALKLPLDNLDQRIAEAMKMVGLGESFRKRNPFELSGGEKRRVALASTLVLNQDVIILDEPTAGLDNDGIKEIYQLIQNIALNKQRQIIVVTHDLRHVLEYTDYVFVFANSKVVGQGKPIDVMYNVDLLTKHQLHIPKLVQLTYDLKKAGIELPKTRSIDEFVQAYHKHQGVSHD